MHFNIGGAKTHEDFLFSLVMNGNVDVLCLSETHTRDHNWWKIFRERTGLTVFVCSRIARVGDKGDFSRSRGGVAIINCNPREISLTLIDHDPRGIICVDVRKRHGGRLPFFLTSMYLSPVGSKYSNDKEAILALAQHYIRRAIRTYGDNVVIATDSNSRLPNYEGLNYTIDQFSNRYTTMFENFLSTCNLLPLHGRSIDTFADYTSLKVGGQVGQSIVDYILAPTSWNLSRYKIGTPVPWYKIPQSSTHRPISAMIKWTRSNTVNVPDVITTAPRFSSPAYSNPIWEEVAISAIVAFNSDSPDAVILRDPTASSTTSYSALINLYTSCLDNTIPAKKNRITPPTGEQGNGRAGKQHNKAQDRSASVRPQRNIYLPQEIVALIKASQVARKIARKVRDNVTRDNAKTAHQRSNNAMRDFHRKNAKTACNALATLRLDNPRAFFRAVEEVTPKNPHLIQGTQLIPNEDGCAPAVPRFTDAFKETFCQPRVLPSGATNAAWIDLIPAAPSIGLGRIANSSEVKRVLYGHQALPLLCNATGHPSDICPLCKVTNDNIAVFKGRGDYIHSPPSCSMSINTSSVCSGDISAIHLCFPHSDINPTITRDFRDSLASAIATVFNAALRTGIMPPDSIHSIVTSLHKPPRTGADTNYASPACYRSLFLGKAVTKVIGTLILARITHWIRTHRLVSTSHQGAFSPGLGGIWNLWAALEYIKNAWALGHSIYIIFIDFTMAYDKVNPDAFRIIMRKMGVPHNLANLILNWMINRTASVRVNGTISEAMRIEMGLGQGEAPAPVYFNIFINLLALYIKSLPGVAGITIEGLSFKIFLFADDVKLPSSSPFDAQNVLTATNDWAVAWGMEINNGIGKTEGVAFLSPQARAQERRIVLQGEVPTVLPPLFIIRNGINIPIKWVETYKYLGYTLTSTLSTITHAGMRTRMEAAYARVFGYNTILWRTNALLRAQLFKTYVIGSIGYTLPLVGFTQEAMKEINSTIYKFIRRTLGLGSKAPTVLLITEGSIPSAENLITRSRLTLALTLRHSSVVDAPAVALRRAIVDSDTHRTTKGILQSWMHVNKDWFHKYTNSGIPAPFPADPFSIKSVSKAFARRVVYHEIRAQMIKDGISLRDTPSLKPPRSYSSHQYIADLAFGFSFTNEMLGEYGVATNLSIRGPMCSGSLLTLSTGKEMQSFIKSLARSRLGPVALTMSPVAPEGWRPAFKAPGDEYHIASIGHICPLCNAGGQNPADPYHIICVCTHPDVAGVRKQLQQEIIPFLQHLAETCYIAQSKARRGAPLLLIARQALDNFLKTLHNIDWTSDSGKFLLFRVCLVLPFPSVCVPMAHRLNNTVWHFGELLDAVCVRDHLLREIANMWVRWGGRSYLRITEVWKTAINA